MPSRRLPSGGLAALAVVLASLAVVVVAGARPSILAGTAPSPPSHHVTARHPRPVRRRTPSTPARTTAPTIVIVTRYVTAPPATTTPTTAVTTTTVHRAPSSTTTTTTPPPPAPTELTGSFASGTSVETRLGSVTTVDVEVPAGVDVHLDVTCGLVTADATSMRDVSVRVEGGGASCTATFSVPSSTPRPARWRLTAS